MGLIFSALWVKLLYDAKGKIGVAIFILWAVFIAIRYYLCVLFPEFTSDDKSDVIKTQRQTIFLSIMTILVELCFVYKYFNIFLFWVSG